jgi:hypothetical protein
VLEIIQRLGHAGRARLAAVLERIHEIPIGEYSASLHVHQPEVPLEPAMRDAFMAAMAHRPDSEDLCRELERHRVLMTATHLTASEGPTFLAVHLVATSGLPPDRPYLVGAFSGVPFSNPAWSGCLNYSRRHALEALLPQGSPLHAQARRNERQRALDSPERRLSLIPGRYRDALVYRATMPDTTPELLGQLTPRLRKRLPATSDLGFPAWALQAAQALTAPLLPHPGEVVYLDLNEVIRLYLMRVLPDGGHPMHRLLFEEHPFGDHLPAFCLQRADGKRLRVAHLPAEGLDANTVLEGLASGRLCPGLALTFCSLAFCSGFLCLGSFEQVEYLHAFRERLDEVDWPEAGMAGRVRVDGLTTGRLLAPSDGEPFYPLDAVLGTRYSPPPATTTVGEMIRPLLPRLLGDSRVPG